TAENRRQTCFSVQSSAAVISRFADFPSPRLARLARKAPPGGLVPTPPPSSLDTFIRSPPRHRLRSAEPALALFLPVTPRWDRFALPTPPGGLQPPPS